MSVPFNTTFQTIYTCPTGKTVILKQISLGAISAAHDMRVEIVGQGAAVSCALVQQNVASNNAALISGLFVVLEPTDYIRVNVQTGGAGSGKFGLYGAILDGVA